MRPRCRCGYSLVELACAIALTTTLSAIAIPRILVGLDDARALGAARYFTGLLYHARMEAVARSASVALRFERTAAGYVYAIYVDGNRTGVLSRDIQRGIDRQLQPPERLTDRFPGVDFGTLPALPPVDAGAPPPGADPVRVGSSDILTFSALGTSSSGSLYILGRQGAQYVVRVFGDTGKIRLVRFDSRSKRWIPL